MQIYSISLIHHFLFRAASGNSVVSAQFAYYVISNQCHYIIHNACLCFVCKIHRLIFNSLQMNRKSSRDYWPCHCKYIQRQNCAAIAIHWNVFFTHSTYSISQTNWIGFIIYDTFSRMVAQNSYFVFIFISHLISVYIMFMKN